MSNPNPLRPQTRHTVVAGFVDRVDSEIRGCGNDRWRSEKIEPNVGQAEVPELPIFKPHNQTENYR